MPSSPVLLHIYLVVLHALIPCVAAYILPLFLYFLALSKKKLHLDLCYLLLGKAVLNGGFGANSNLTVTNSSSSEEMNIAVGKCDSGL